MGPKPGQIRCPTCHRSTTPAAYCTHCGSPIPEGARTRPRGLDRDELQERIRARHSGPMPFRRGADDEEGWQAPPTAERYVPEPEDERLRRRRGGATRAGGTNPGAPSDRRVDNTSPTFDADAEREAERRREDAAVAAAIAGTPLPDEPPGGEPLDEGPVSAGPHGDQPVDRRWTRPSDAEAAAPRSPFRRGREAGDAAGSGAGAAGGPPASAAGSGAWVSSRNPDPEPDSPLRARQPARSVERSDPPEIIDRFDDDAYEPDERYAYDNQRGGGIGVGAVLGIAALGVLALFVGVMLSGLFGDDGVGQASPTPSVVGAAPSADASAGVGASGAPIEAPTETPAPAESASGGPVTFPDGFVAEAQPCANPPNSPDCGSSGARNAGNVWIVVSFRNGTASDVVAVEVERADGTAVPGGGSLQLADIQCAAACNGYTYFAFQNLENGTYQVQVLRNGEDAGETGFTVER